MKLRLAACAALLSVSVTAGAEQISDPDTVSHLLAVHKSLRAVSSEVTRCANEGGDRKECVCQYEALVLEFHATIKQLLNAHPDITNYSTVSFAAEGDNQISQNIPALVRQVQNPPKCS